MKPRNAQFENFLNRARRGRPDPASPAPYGLAAAVAARWKSAEPSSVPLLALQLARWGMACALVISFTFFLTFNRPPQTSALMELAGAVDDPASGE